MQLKIAHKLFLAFLTILLLVVSTVVISRQLFLLNFKNYIREVELEKLQTLVPELQEAYLKEGNWNSVVADPHYWLRRLDIGSKVKDAIPPPPSPGPEFKPHGGPEIVLLDKERNPLLGDFDRLDTTKLISISAGGAIVGWLGITSPGEERKKEPAEWLERQNRQLFIVGVIVLSVTALIAILVSRHLLKPIHALNGGAKALADRKFGTLVSVRSRDELGQLAESFNTLSRTLQRYENMRHQWLSDISHELRTPLAILQGEIEALHDGVRKPTSDNLASLRAEVLRLSKLVEDLHQLTMSDSSYLRMDEKLIEPDHFIEQAVNEYSSRFSAKDMTCELSLQFPRIARIRGDEGRLMQVFRNIFENCCRYIGTGGKIVVSGIEAEGRININIDDSGPGVPDEALPKLFDRLYRVDTSRSRESGGSGLGLSICRSIIEAHGGSINASVSRLGGLCISMSLPVETDDSQ